MRGIVVQADGRDIAIEAKKGVVIATGGHTGNVNFRRMFDPRLTEEYQQAGLPYSFQGADGELAAMDIGASLWATGTQTSEVGPAITKTRHVGTRWGYLSLYYETDSPIFHLAKATGLTVTDWQEAILVNQFGKRFWNELDSCYDFINAALGNHGDDDKLNGGGPIWAIFDADAVARQKWKPQPPHVDPDGYFASADTIFELAGQIRNPYQKQPISGAVLQETVNRYNSFVTSGVDTDFNKPTPLHQIAKPPFYAAWSTPILHDSLTGLAHRHQRAGDRHSRRGDPGALLRGRIARRLRAAWARPLPGVRPHRRPPCGATEFVRSMRERQNNQPRGVGRADAGGRGRDVSRSRSARNRPRRGEPRSRSAMPSGAVVASARSAISRWPGTEALFWTALDVPAPASRTSHEYTVRCADARRSSRFSVAATAKPEHTLTVDGHRAGHQGGAGRRRNPARRRSMPAPTRPAAPSSASARASTRLQLWRTAHIATADADHASTATRASS